MSDGQDRLIERVRDTLRSAPEAAPDPQAMARVLSAVWESPKPSSWGRMFDAWRMPVLSGLGAAAVTGVALLVGFISRGAVVERMVPEPTTASGAPTGEYPVQLVSATVGEVAPVLTQFILDGVTAERVSIVGGFNDWRAGATPLVRLASGVWTASVPLIPGRHVYAFVLDDTLVVADPRAPKAGDADYGQEGSVVMVFAR